MPYPSMYPPMYPSMCQPPYQEQSPKMRTVWTDLDNERGELSKEEKTFIENDAEYQKADYELQMAFQSFMQGMFRDDFIKSDTRGLAEKKLLALKVARKEYGKQNDGIFDDPEIKALIEKKRSEKNGN